MADGVVVAVHRSQGHTFSKAACPEIRLIAGIGVDGDAHAGATVKHRSRVRRDPSQPNLRQVHLIHSELLDELREKGYDVRPGVMGENITTLGIDLLGLPTGTRLSIGDSAQIEVTGLRNPCSQLDGYQAGLMEAVLERRAGGEVVRKAGVMAVVILGGVVRPGDGIAVTLPGAPFRPMEVV